MDPVSRETRPDHWVADETRMRREKIAYLGLEDELLDPCCGRPLKRGQLNQDGDVYAWLR